MYHKQNQQTQPYKLLALGTPHSQVMTFTLCFAIGKRPQVGIFPKCGLGWAITLGSLFCECPKPWGGGGLHPTLNPIC